MLYNPEDDPMILDEDDQIVSNILNDIIDRQECCQENDDDDDDLELAVQVTVDRCTQGHEDFDSPFQDFLDYGDQDNRLEQQQQQPQPEQQQRKQQPSQLQPQPLENGINNHIHANEEHLDDTKENQASQSMSEDPEHEYIVEEIVSKKLDSRGFAKYLVKWKNFPSSENTWEPLEYLIGCDEIMQNFEQERAKRIASRIQRQNGSNGTTRRPSDHPEFEVNDVMGITEANGQRYFLISLANSTQKAFIRAPLAHRVIPDKVIDFYVKHLRWKQKPE